MRGDESYQVISTVPRVPWAFSGALETEPVSAMAMPKSITAAMVSERIRHVSDRLAGFFETGRIPCLEQGITHASAAP